MRLLQALLLLFAAAMLSPAEGKGRELTIGLSSTVTSMDPHYHNLTPNNSLLRHVFDTLIRQDANQTLIPGLARRWQALDDRTWELTLRHDVRWHDGTPFTADDVAFTLKRAADVPNSPSSFAAFVRQITAVEIKNPHTLRIKTAAPAPLLPNDLSSVMIVSRKHGERATTDDYNSGKAAVGTGPYKFVEYTPNQRVVLGANFGYWGGEEPWEKVTFKMLSNPASRVAALLSGDVDMIEGVPTADITDLRRNTKVRLANRVSNRVIYLHLDSGRKEKSPFTFDKQGNPLAKNPLADARVRMAISKAIDRNAIVSKIMEGNALAAGQLLADGFFGVSKNLKPEKLDPDGARKLLAEAGYPDGFALTLHSPNNRYINDAAVAQAIAQMLTRVGIQTKVDAMPASVFFTRASKLEFSLILAGWGAESGETSSPLRALLATYDKDKGNGSANRGRYSNPALDKLLDQALGTIDDLKRAALLAQAAEVGIRDAGIVPLHYEISTWAMRAGLRFVPRADQYTFAMDLRS